MDLAGQKEQDVLQIKPKFQFMYPCILIYLYFTKQTQFHILVYLYSCIPAYLYFAKQTQFPHF